MNYHTYSLNPNEINDCYVHKSSSRDRKPNNLISSVFDCDRRENYYKSIESKVDINTRNMESIHNRRYFNMTSNQQITTPRMDLSLSPKREVKLRPSYSQYGYCRKLPMINSDKILNNLMRINENIEPRFKLARIDIEQIRNSSYVREWNKPVNQELLVKIKKEQRRKEYWNQRVLPPKCGVFFNST